MSYNQLRAWIDAQEAFERQNGRPAPLTDEQRRALAVLVPPPMVLPAGDGVLEASTDWISRLMQYEQSRPHPETALRAEFVDEPVAEPGGGPPYWRCWCRLPREAPTRRFPDADTVAADPHHAVFIRKKDAKKFAAQCAVRWLVAHHYMPMPAAGDGLVGSSLSAAYTTCTPIARQLSALPLSLTFSTSPPPRPPVPALGREAQRTAAAAAAAAAAASRQTLPSSSPEESTLADYRARLSRPADDDNDTSPPPPLPASTPASTAKVSSMASWQSSSPSSKRRRGSDGDGSSNVHSLQKLCQKLGMAMPELRVTACSGPNTGFFDGVAVFLPQKNRPTPAVLPAGAGTVSMVYTREATREKLAQSVMAHLASISAAVKDQ